MLAGGLVGGAALGLMPGGGDAARRGAVVVAPSSVEPVAAAVVGAAVVAPRREPTRRCRCRTPPAGARATTPATTARERRGGIRVMGLSGFMCRSWTRPASLRAVPAQHHPLEHADERRGGGAQEGEHEDRAPQLQRQVERLRLLHGVARGRSHAGEELGRARRRSAPDRRRCERPRRGTAARAAPAAGRRPRASTRRPSAAARGWPGRSSGSPVTALNRNGTKHTSDGADEDRLQAEPEPDHQRRRVGDERRHLHEHRQRRDGLLDEAASGP